MPLLPRLVLGMPLILIVLVVGMSQITSIQILGLTKPNYNTPRICPLIFKTSHRSSQIKSYHTGSPIVTFKASQSLSFWKVVSTIKILKRGKIIHRFFMNVDCEKSLS